MATIGRVSVTPAPGRLGSIALKSREAYDAHLGGAYRDWSQRERDCVCVHGFAQVYRAIWWRIICANDFGYFPWACPEMCLKEGRRQEKTSLSKLFCFGWCLGCFSFENVHVYMLCLCTISVPVSHLSTLRSNGCPLGLQLKITNRLGNKGTIATKHPKLAYNTDFCANEHFFVWWETMFGALGCEAASFSLLA